MATATLDTIRGMLQATPENRLAELSLVSVEGGFELVSGGLSLQASRGDVRVFRTADAAVRYVSDHIAKSISRSVEVRFLITAGGLF